MWSSTLIGGGQSHKRRLQNQHPSDLTNESLPTTRLCRAELKRQRIRRSRLRMKPATLLWTAVLTGIGKLDIRAPKSYGKSVVSRNERGSEYTRGTSMISHM